MKFVLFISLFILTPSVYTFNSINKIIVNSKLLRHTYIRFDDSFIIKKIKKII